VRGRAHAIVAAGPRCTAMQPGTATSSTEWGRDRVLLRRRLNGELLDGVQGVGDGVHGLGVYLGAC
jgi:hypothetical protein